MKRLAVIYHSGHGRTAHIAGHVTEGAGGRQDIGVDLLLAQDLAQEAQRLCDYDGLILGSPTYLGGVSGPFKSFMDATGPLWRTQKLKGKLAAGFTVSSVNRLGSWSGLMAQAGHADAFPPGDIKTARLFGRRPASRRAIRSTLGTTQGACPAPAQAA